MATIFPPFRSLAPRTALTWDGNNTNLGGAVIDGNQADFASIVGGEQVTISRAGGPATLITMIAGDITALLVAARINAAFPGLASVNGEGGIRLIDATSVEVTTISAPDQVKLGLPAAMFRSAVLGAQPTVRADRAFLVDRTDLASTPVAIPDGANRLAMWLDLLGNDGTEVGCTFIVAFNNGVEGIITTNILQGAVSTSLEFVVDDDGSRVYKPVIEQLYMGALGSGLHLVVPVEIDVPPGATAFTVAVAAASSPDGVLAYSPATISGGVIPGVR